ncbi:MULTISPECIES: ATP-dependent Clp protease proteolytic subunit [unclassified Nocardioides]
MRPQEIREDTERDLVLSATEAVAYGVVDTVLDSRKKAGARVVGPA